MKKITSIPILLALISLTVLTTCRKEKVSDLPCRGFIYEVKEWIYFESGTYWIYKEENTGAIDSVYVTYATDYNYSKGHDFYVETKSSYSGYNYSYFRSSNTIAEECHPCIRKNDPCIFIKRDKHKPGNFVGEAYAFAYVSKKASYMADWVSPIGESHTITEDIHKNFTVDTITFSNVVQMFNQHDKSENKSPTRFYYAKNYGIIKKELIDSNQVWNLIRYNILQP